MAQLPHQPTPPLLPPPPSTSELVTFDWTDSTHHHQQQQQQNQSISPRSNFLIPSPLSPIGGSHPTRRPITPHQHQHQLQHHVHDFNPFMKGGSAQLSQPNNRSDFKTSINSASTSSSNTTNHLNHDLDLFSIHFNQSSSNSSDPSSLGSPLTHTTSPKSIPISQTCHQITNQNHEPPANTSSTDDSHNNNHAAAATATATTATSSTTTTTTTTTASTTNTSPTNQNHNHNPLPRSTTTLWMGDLESWMDEDYVRNCIIGMGWHLPRSHSNPTSSFNIKIKMVSGASPSSAYCFLTYPNAELARQAWNLISNMPPTLMPGCERTFKLNWATGLPGVQPTWDREFSVFIRDLDREVSEGELVSLFTQTFPSTKSAKIMGDLSTGLSRGYAFIRFGEESDMHRALALGKSKSGTGMYLRGRLIKISEASGSSGTAGDHHLHHHRSSLSQVQSPQPNKSSTTTTSNATNPSEHLKPRHASLNVLSDSSSQSQNHSLHSLDHPHHHLKLESQPIHRGSLPASSITNDGAVNLIKINHQSNGPSNNHLQASSLNSGLINPIPNHHHTGSSSIIPNHQTSSTQIGSSTSSNVPTHSSVVRPGLQTIPNFRQSINPNSTNTPSSFQILPFQQRAGSVCISPTTAPTNGLIYTTTTPTSNSNNLGCSTRNSMSNGLSAHHHLINPTSALPTPIPTLPHHHHHPQVVYPAMNHMRNSIAAPGYIPEPFHAPQPTPAGLSPYQIHPGLMNFYTTSPPPPPTTANPTGAGYFTTSAHLAAANSNHFATLAQIAVAANHANNDPSNTTVFVGGLPACISEETLKTFFQNFGEITYVKIPPNKGCGFVQYVRRADAEAAMLKMHDFPIHGKSRIRLSWGRSLGDKQVEYVKKLSTALGIPFESVWKIVEGQDHSTIKQIASAFSSNPGGSPHHSSPPSAHGAIPTANGPFHAIQPNPINPPTALLGINSPYAVGVDHLVDPLGFNLQHHHQQQQQQQQHGARIGNESNRYSLDQQLQSFNPVLDLRNNKDPVDQDVSLGTSNGVTSRAGHHQFDRRMRSASDHQILANHHPQLELNRPTTHADNPSMLTNERLALSSHDLFPRSSINHSSQPDSSQPHSLYQSSQPTTSSRHSEILTAEPLSFQAPSQKLAPHDFSHPFQPSLLNPSRSRLDDSPTSSSYPPIGPSGMNLSNGPGHRNPRLSSSFVLGDEDDDSKVRLLTRKTSSPTSTLQHQQREIAGLDFHHQQQEKIEQQKKLNHDEIWRLSPLSNTHSTHHPQPQPSSHSTPRNVWLSSQLSTLRSIDENHQHPISLGPRKLPHSDEDPSSFLSPPTSTHQSGNQTLSDLMIQNPLLFTDHRSHEDDEEEEDPNDRLKTGRRSLGVLNHKKIFYDHHHHDRNLLHHPTSLDEEERIRMNKISERFMNTCEIYDDHHPQTSDGGWPDLLNFTTDLRKKKHDGETEDHRDVGESGYKFFGSMNALPDPIRKNNPRSTTSTSNSLLQPAALSFFLD